MNKLDRIGKLLSEAKRIAKEYREETGKPLGITGEVAEYEAARKLGLDLCEARQPGYDAIRIRDNRIEKIQIKGRRLPADAKRGRRVGSIRPDHEWDFVVLVLLDGDFEPLEIFEANRSNIELALKKPGSKARNEKGALAVSKFKSISRLVWSRDKDNA